MLIGGQNDSRSSAFMFPFCNIDRQYELATDQVNQNHGVTVLQGSQRSSACRGHDVWRKEMKT